MFNGTKTTIIDKFQNFKVLLLTQKLFKSIEISEINALKPFWRLRENLKLFGEISEILTFLFLEYNSKRLKISIKILIKVLFRAKNLYFVVSYAKIRAIFLL